jgi:hypothetical protein
MEDFERQLKNALAPKEQPPAFEAKVFAAIAANRSARRIIWRWAAAIAAVLLIATGFWTQHEREVQERTAGEAAKARLQLALKITVTELSKIQQTVRTSTEEE